MSERSDMELLREYAEGGGEAAFREIVVRHTDLLYSAALRQVESPDQARDVLQNVFADLARKARLVSRTEREGSSLAGWLYRGVRFECANQRREQRRRRDRERIAMAEADTPSEPESDWTRIGPVLDEAIAELSDADREALLLRFFRNQDFKAVGRSLGVSDDTAQKRVSRALERLRSRFLRRGLPTSAAALSAVLSSSAVHAAPTGLAAALSVSATAWAAMPPVAVASLSQAIAMTTFKKIVVGTAFAAAVGTGIYETREAVRWRREVGDLVEKQEALLRRTEEAEQAREAAARELADKTREHDRDRTALADLARLKDELTRLRAREAHRQQHATNSGEKRPEAKPDPFTQNVLEFTAKAAELNRRLASSPQWRIPELAYLTESDWLEAGKMARLGNDDEVRQSLMALRGRAKHNAYSAWQDALKGYLDANGGQLPSDTLDLKPYFAQGVEDSLLRRYRMTRSGAAPGPDDGPVWLIEEVAPADDRFDTRMRMGLGSLDISPIAEATP